MRRSRVDTDTASEVRPAPVASKRSSGEERPGKRQRLVSPLPTPEPSSELHNFSSPVHTVSFSASEPDLRKAAASGRGPKRRASTPSPDTGSPQSPHTPPATSPITTFDAMRTPPLVLDMAEVDAMPRTLYRNPFDTPRTPASAFAKGGLPSSTFTHRLSSTSASSPWSGRFSLKRKLTMENRQSSPTPMVRRGTRLSRSGSPAAADEEEDEEDAIEDREDEEGTSKDKLDAHLAPRTEHSPSPSTASRARERSPVSPTPVRTRRNS